MRFMWEGKKYERIGMPFGLALALRLATNMMAPVIRYQITIYIDDLILHCRSYQESMT